MQGHTGGKIVTIQAVRSLLHGTLQLAPLPPTTIFLARFGGCSLVVGSKRSGVFVVDHSLLDSFGEVDVACTLRESRGRSRGWHCIFETAAFRIGRG